MNLKKYILYYFIFKLIIDMYVLCKVILIVLRIVKYFKLYNNITAVL